MALLRSRLAYERLKKFATERRRIPAAYEDDLTLAHSLSKFSRNSHELAPYISGSYRDSVWESIVQLFLLPWWSRAWIVQEACYGPSPMICYGDIMIHFSVFQNFLNHFQLGRGKMVFERFMEIPWSWDYSQIPQELEIYCAHFLVVAFSMSFDRSEVVCINSLAQQY